MPRRKKADPAALPPPPADEGYAKTIDVSQMSAEDVGKLEAQVHNLKEQLAAAKDRATDAEARVAEALQFTVPDGVQEVPSGHTVKVRKFKEWKSLGFKDNGDEIVKPVFSIIAVPSFYYRIDLPPCGGSDLKINGMPMFHGQRVEVDIDTLRTVKEIVYRCWDHDRSIHGSDENFYRKQKRPLISARAFQ